MRFTNWMLSLVMILGVVSTTLAEDEAGKSADEKTELRSSVSKDGKTTACFGACTVNFREELKVPFNYLSKLGSEIHEARLVPDPVALAAAANSLAAAEKVAGKTAKITSKQVMDEAIEIVKLRGDEMELKAVAILSNDQAVAKDLLAMAKSISENANSEEGESSREIYGDLIVDNHTHHDLKIFVDHRYVGTVRRGQHRHLHVHAHNWHNHLDAYCASDNDLISHKNVSGHLHRVYWHIDE